MNDLNLTLTTEQEFQLAAIAATCENLSREEIIGKLLDVAKILMIKDQIIRDALRKGVLFETEFKSGDNVVND